ncbi:MAG: UDP-3-O-(3-hydroxymyristoyl)glucosamine N-acyltransferase [Chitinophagaceae bacterium]
MKKIDILTIAKAVNGTLIGNNQLIIDIPNQIEEAKENQITFIGSKKYASLWQTTQASAVIVTNNITLPMIENKAIITVNNADIAMSQVLDLFAPDLPGFDNNIHPTAVIEPSASLGAGVNIGANCYVGKNVVLGNDVCLYPNTTVFDDTTIGDKTVIWSGTVIRERTVIGANCIIHSNVSIGADGFGFRPREDGRGLQKITHIGNVVIGNDVEIGANTCIDRAKFTSTVIGDGCKIDNLVQIGHNSKMGRSCIMAGSSGLAGSVTLGDGVIIGGGACISDHVTLGNGVQVGGQSGVINNFEAGKKILGYPAVESRDALKQWVILRKLAKES